MLSPVGTGRFGLILIKTGEDCEVNSVVGWLHLDETSKHGRHEKAGVGIWRRVRDKSVVSMT